MAFLKKLLQIFFVLILGLFILNSTYAWYNDTSLNDSCLTMESDAKTYWAGPDNTFDSEIKIENACGSAVIGSVGFYFETRQNSKTSIISMTQATKMKTIQLIDWDPDSNTGFIEKQVPNYELVDLKLSQYTLPFSEKMGFSKKTSYDITIPKGESYLKVKIRAPFEDGEFVINIVDYLDNTKKSTLDPFFSGAGTAASPYAINTCQNLQDMAPYCLNQNIYFVLEDDIDCTDFGNFSPICGRVDLNEFKGHFDGKSHTITGVTINAASDTTGLFGGAGYDCTIKNVGLVDFNVWNAGASASWTGGLVGSIAGCDVNNVYISNSTIGSATNLYVGGLFGAYGSTGSLNDGNLTNSYADNVSVYADNSTRVGGIAGNFTGFSDATCHTYYVYSTGHVQGGATAVGGVTGYDGGYNDTNGVLWDTQTSGQATSAIGTGFTTAEMKQQATYESFGFDFDNVWSIEEGVNYPYLSSFSATVPSVTLDVNITGINGIERFGGLPYINEDSNIEIVISIKEQSNARLTLDLNYSTSSSHGTGTSFYKDLNLDSDYCAATDWNDVNTSCIIEFNPAGLGDNNYYFHAEITDETSTDSNTSWASVGIDGTDPTAAAITITGFLIQNGEIDETGTIEAVFSDSGNSQLDFTSCEYTLSGLTWIPGTWAGTTCSSTEFSISNGTTYNFNLRMSDNAQNIGLSEEVVYLGNENLVNPEDIKTEDFKNIGMQSIYNLFSGLGGMAFVLIVLLLAFIVFFVLIVKN